MANNIETVTENITEGATKATDIDMDMDMDDFFEYDIRPYLFLALLYFLYLLYMSDTKLVEGFESYTSCVNQGYGQEFCLNTQPDSCINCHKELKDKFVPRTFFTFSS